MFFLAACIRRVGVAVLCFSLFGCITVVKSEKPPASPTASPVVDVQVEPVVTRRSVSMNAPRLDAAHTFADVPEPADIDFRILDGRATIGSREYVLDIRNRPLITALGEGTYRLDLPLRRDSRRSLRADEVIVTHFYYDGVELVFFGDKNRNQRFDRHESGARHVIRHTEEVVVRGNRRYVQSRELKVVLDKRHISSSQRLKSLDVRLIFQIGR